MGRPLASINSRPSPDPSLGVPEAYPAQCADSRCRMAIAIRAPVCRRPPEIPWSRAMVLLRERGRRPYAACPDASSPPHVPPRDGDVVPVGPAPQPVPPWRTAPGTRSRLPWSYAADSPSSRAPPAARATGCPSSRPGTAVRRLQGRPAVAGGGGRRRLRRGGGTPRPLSSASGRRGAVPAGWSRRSSTRSAGTSPAGSRSSRSTWDSPVIAQRYRATSIPMLLILDRGRVVDTPRRRAARASPAAPPRHHSRRRA